MPKKTKTQENNVIKLYDNEQSAELAFLNDIDIADDGLDVVEASEVRYTSYVPNMKVKGPDGRLTTPDVFYSTLDETVHDSLQVVPLLWTKTNLWSYWDNSQSKTIKVCRSGDRRTGRLIIAQDSYGAAGTERGCKGCPEAKWREVTDDQGNARNTLPCVTVHNIIAFDLATGRPCTLKFLRSSEKAFLTHLQRHHIGARRLPDGKRANVPLFTYELKLTLEMADNNNYAVPVFERGRVLNPEEFKHMMQASIDAREYFAEVLEQAEEREDAIESNDADQIDDDDGFVDAQAS